VSDATPVYVGPPDLHDGTVLAIEERGADVAVRIRSFEGREFELRFRGVQAVRGHRAEGMLLYALTERREAPSVRRFTFANWDEEDDARLEIDAQELHVESSAPAG